MKTFIIAEAGVNHNGSLSRAIEMVSVAATLGADAIKFQTFFTSEVISKLAPKAQYQIDNTHSNESQFEMVKKLELTEENHFEIIKHCDNNNIEFMTSAFDLKSIELLESFNLKRIKIPSGEINNLPYLRKIKLLKMPVILSSGMSTMKEIEAAINILTENGKKNKDITVLHCNTQYPTPYVDVNLKAMNSIKKKFGVPVGYSDHTLGIEVPIAAVSLGAKVIEKHFTLDKSLKGPDHIASLNPKEFSEMVTAIRNIEKVFGSGIKKPSPSEFENIKIARKSLIAKKNIKKGEVFSEHNLTTKRPGTGISPIEWDQYIGQNSNYDYKKDDFIKSL